MLGIFRVFLALMVASDHTQLPYFGSILFDGWGTAPVEAFFCISGFYMAMVLDTKYQGRVGIFYLSRALRIYPALLTVVALTFALMLLDGQTTMLAWSQPASDFFSRFASLSLWDQLVIVVGNLFAFGSNFFILSSFDGTSAYSFLFFPPAWTLGIEMTFYLLAPLLMWRWPVVVILLGCLLPGLLKWLAPGPETEPYLLYCLLGMLSYFVYSVLPHNRMVRAIGLAMFCCLVAFALVSDFLPGDNRLHIRAFVAFTCLSLPFMFTASRENQTDRWIGELSYGIYVSHFLVFKLLLFVGIQPNAWLYPPSLVLAGAAIVLLVEQPVDRHRARLASKATRQRGREFPSYV
jgi:peptidoglycan/LPS O-acetylase OafA/YrhL